MNMRAAVQRMVADAGGPNDRMAFVTSSHGSGDGNGASYLCLLPDPIVGVSASERAGQYWDYELAVDLGGNGQNQSHTFVFIDACFSGGLKQRCTSHVNVQCCLHSGIAGECATDCRVYHMYS